MRCNFFNRPVTFGLFFALYTIVQVSVGIYIAGIFTTLEKQYRITSSVAGIVLSISDVASLISVVLVTYVGKNWHRPRIVGVLGILSGVGGILSGVPHLLYPAYREGDGIQVSGNGTSSTVHVCDAARIEANCTAEDISDAGSRIHETWALFLGQALMGFAYGPLFPIALTYIDDQVRGTTTPYYISVILIAGTSASLVGFGQGYLFLRLNVNWPAPPDYTKEWLGAWWMGFIVDGAAMILISIPFFFFPKAMDIDINEEDIPSEKLTLEEKERQPNTELGVKDFLGALRRLVTNFVFMAVLLGSVFDLAVAASFGFFMAKFLEVQFNIIPAATALYVGIIITPTALVGHICGGLLVKKLKLTSRGCAWLIVTLNTLIMFCIPGIYFLACPEPRYAGFADGAISTTNPCNADCTCSSGGYEPVCGNDGLTYATPCFAGCTGQHQETTGDPAVKITVYTGCTCSAGGNATNEFAEDAVQGKCVEPCNMIYFAGILLMGVVLFGTVSKNPLLILTMRAVGDDKTFGLGIQTLFGRALGFLPAPIYFGAAIQGACILERLECGISGDCLIYDAQKYRLIFLGIFFGIEAGTLIFYAIATAKVTIDHNKAGKESEYEKDTVLQNGTKDLGMEGADNKGYNYDAGDVGTQTELTAF